MSRTQRLIINNAVYHVMVRGNQKQKTFLEENDFGAYIGLLRHYKKEYSFRLYGYCLMPNHVHLLLEVKNGSDLSKIMQGLNQSYTIWFNSKYKKVGHLWQGRYKSMVVQKNKYLLDCLEYIELNPVRANMINSPFSYQWSSWKARFGYKQNDLLDTPEL